MDNTLTFTFERTTFYGWDRVGVGDGGRYLVGYIRNDHGAWMAMDPDDHVSGPYPSRIAAVAALPHTAYYDERFLTAARPEVH